MYELSTPSQKLEPVDWRAICLQGDKDRDASLRELQYRMDAEGMVPLMPHGWRVVVDDPDGMEGLQYEIPSKQFITYFSEGMVPISCVGHYYRMHDVAHLPGYGVLFRSLRVSEMVRRLSGIALQKPAWEQGDFAQLIDLASEDATVPHARSAMRVNLGLLIQFDPKWPADIEPWPLVRELEAEMFAAPWRT